MPLRFAITAAAALLPSVQAHIIMAQPVPYSVDKIDNSPITASQFPCKSQNGFTVSTMNNMAVGSQQTIKFKGTAVHGGGSCQLSVTTDTAPTANSVFKVIKSIEGGCPGTDGSTNTYNFQLPASIPNGKATFAWTWFSKMSGAPELYMNCAPIQVTGGASDKTAFNALPDMLVANIGKGCTTAQNFATKFPSPGKEVEEGKANDQKPPNGSCGSSSGGGGSSSGGDSSSGGGGGSSSGGGSPSGGSGGGSSGGSGGGDGGGGGSSSGGGGGSSSGGGGSGQPSSPQASPPAGQPSPPGGASGGGASGGGASGGGASGGGASGGSGASGGGASGGGASGGGASGGGAPAAPSPAPSPAPPNPGGVFAPGAAGPSGALTSTTLITVTAPSGSQPTPPSSPGSDGPAAPAQPSSGTGSAPAPAPGGGGSSGGGSTCTQNGAIVCNGTTQFGICNNGKVVWQAVAAGTSCSNGAISKRGYNGRIARPRMIVT